MLNLICLSAAAQLSSASLAPAIPDIEGGARTVFSGFDQLQSLGAYVVTKEGKSLGLVSRSQAADSLGNAAGAGSTIYPDGLFNTISRYGSEISPTSAFNTIATEPPAIVVIGDIVATRTQLVGEAITADKERP